MSNESSLINSENFLIKSKSFVADYSFITGEYSNIDSLIDSNCMVHYNYKTLVRGYKHYELSNHLGNVLAVFSDKRITLCSSSVVSGYEADVVSASDYYPFGMLMSGRSYSSPDYRYGFNGKEKIKELNGEGVNYDFGSRLFDSRLGSWLSLDPIMECYPQLSPYSYCAGNPIYYIDHAGKKILIHYIDDQGKSVYYEYGSKQTLPNNDFVKETVKALDYVSQKRESRRQIKRAMKENEELRIVQIDKNDPNKDPNLFMVIPVDNDGDGNTDDNLRDENGDVVHVNLLYLDPKAKTEVWTKGNWGSGKTISASIALFHEIVHWNHILRNFKRTVRLGSKAIEGYDNKEEKRTIRKERRLARKLGEGKRRSHRGTMVPSSGSTDHSDVPSSGDHNRRRRPMGG